MVSCRSCWSSRALLALGVACAFFAVALGGAAASARSEPRVRVEVLEDASRALTYADVAGQAAAFAPLDPARANVGYSSSVFWLRIAVETDADEPTSWILEMARWPDRAELYGGVTDAPAGERGLG